jgi:hypothetical protein
MFLNLVSADSEKALLVATPRECARMPFARGLSFQEDLASIKIPYS